MKYVQLLTYSSYTLPSLAGVYGCRDNEGGVEVQFNLEAKRSKSSRRKNAPAFASRVLISASTSPSLDITLPISLHILCSLVQRLLAVVMSAG